MLGAIVPWQRSCCAADNVRVHYTRSGMVVFLYGAITEDTYCCHNYYKGTRWPTARLFVFPTFVKIRGPWVYIYSWVIKSHNKIHVFFILKILFKDTFSNCTHESCRLTKQYQRWQCWPTMMNTAFRAEPANNYGLDDWRVGFVRADHKRIKNQTCGRQ